VLHRLTIVFIAVLALLTPTKCQDQPATTSQPPSTGAISKFDRERAIGILNGVSKGVQELYYDPKMNGVDWNAVLEKGRTRITQSNSLNEALTQIAIAISELNDSHTVFVPPARPYQLDFGFEYEMVWSLCLVTRVRPGSDAEAKGIRPGMQIVSINNTSPSRHNLWSIEYLDNVLNPQSEIHLEIQDSSGEKRKIDVAAKISNSSDLAYRPGAGVRYDVIRNNENVRHRMRMSWTEVDGVSIVKFPWFFYPVDSFYWLGKKIHQSRAMIIDLRGNQGGSVDTCKYFLGMFFDHDVKIDDRVGRKKTEVETAKHEPAIYFPGKLIVLVDSRSASAAEIFARVMQLENRAKVIGDKTSGMVMEATSTRA
jgi:C-terminal processing protease CtpA/Prc